MSTYDPVSRDWFRSPDWNSQDQAEFEARLGRARPAKRVQYLRIKAVMIEDRHPDGAEELLRRIIQDHAEHWPEVAGAHERLGDLRRLAGDPTAADHHYRAAFGISPSLSGTSGEVHLKLGELLLERGGSTDEVFAILQAAKAHLTLNTSVFRWHALAARASLKAGDRAASSASADAALQLLGAPPQFSRHPTVGLANASPELTAMLQGLATGGTVPGHRR